ncbi:MAG: ADP-ribosylglycohydrolase family protein [Anaerolineae bacterium]|nr:ADP-ribosylglycohydrolase family protein [Anaerolineae bacterium]
MMTAIPADYDTRVYAGWLGKCIGVRFGAPLEGWTYAEIRDNVGPLTGYLNETPDRLFKPDDDTALPMILIRSLERVLEDGGTSADLTPQQIAEAWLDYLGDQHGTLWWGGYGVSTEHTAYLNLADSIPAPRSGSIAQNGVALAEQIGGQIFSDIWGLVAPGDPALAADLAERASSVSHDGNGIYGGRFVAALVSQAFVASDPLQLIDTGLALIPPESDYARVVRAVVDFYQKHPEDWHTCMAFLQAEFGYDRYPGMVHIIPNAGVIVMALAYGSGDFSRTLQIANMAGWDTDCNVGNVGTILGVAAGLDGIDPAWRAPMNDLLITASVIGTRNLLTIPQCADLFCRLGRQLAGESAGDPPPRYHFRYPGSTSNFQARGQQAGDVVRGRVVELRQVTHGDGRGVLQASLHKLPKKGESRLFTRTCYRPAELQSNYYGASFTPLISPGQTMTARLHLPDSAPGTLTASLYAYDANHAAAHQGGTQPLTPGQWHTLSYTLPTLANACLAETGIVLRNLGDTPWSAGAVYLESFDWAGAPDFSSDFSRERHAGGAISQWTVWRGYWRLEDGAYHGSGPGNCETYTGDITWDDYRVVVRLVPLLGDHHHVLLRVGGARRSYAFGLAPAGRAVLTKKAHGQSVAVAEARFAWQHGQPYTLAVRAAGSSLEATVEGGGQTASLAWVDDNQPYLRGQIGLSVWDGGHLGCEFLQVSPLDG